MGRYEALSSIEDGEEGGRRISSSTEATVRQSAAVPHVVRQRRQWLFPASLGLLVVSAINLIVAFQVRGSTQNAIAKTSLWCKIDQQRCISRSLTILAPALEAVEHVEYDFANDFGQKSPYRGPPTKALEQRWTDLVFRKSITP